MTTTDEKPTKPAKNATEFVTTVKRNTLNTYLACSRYITKQGLIHDSIDSALRAAAHVHFANGLQLGVLHWDKAEMEEAVVMNAAGKDDLLSPESIAWHNQNA